MKLASRRAVLYPVEQLDGRAAPGPRPRYQERAAAGIASVVCSDNVAGVSPQGLSTSPGASGSMNIGIVALLVDFGVLGGSLRLHASAATSRERSA